MEKVMRILHTGDWHIGAKTDDLDRFDEQKEALEQVVRIAKEKQVDMVIIAGDIYDSLIPSAEDEKLFYKVVTELSNNGNTAVIAIAGNHDEPKRMSNANIFADKFGIYLIGYIDEINVDTSRSDKNIYAVESGKGYIKFKTQGGEEAVVAVLPYPSYYRYKEMKREGESFSDKVNEWLSAGVSHFEDHTINITVAHTMSFATPMGEEEFMDKTNLSTTFNFVNQDAYINTKAHYTALGHVHQPICVNKDKNIYYSGALINQYFVESSEEKTSVYIVDLDNTGVKSIEKELLDVKLLRRFKCNSISEANMALSLYPNDLVKIVIENVFSAVDDNAEGVDFSRSDVITFSDIKNLKKQNPNLVTLSVISKEAVSKDSVVSKKDLTSSEIFDNFVMHRTGKAPEQKLKELFLELISEDIYEAD